MSKSQAKTYLSRGLHTSLQCMNQDEFPDCFNKYATTQKSKAGNSFTGIAVAFSTWPCLPCFLLLLRQPGQAHATDFITDEAAKLPALLHNASSFMTEWIRICFGKTKSQTDTLIGVEEFLYCMQGRSMCHDSPPDARTCAWRGLRCIVLFL